jgi:hypothetical protein
MANQDNSGMENTVIGPLRMVLAYCRQNDWAGYDPYDALNSRLIEKFPILNSRIPRIAMTQALKISPVNLRGLLGIPKSQNPKALALFLSSFLILPSEQLLDREELIKNTIRLIAAKRSQDISYWCWGYSFPWQTRKEMIPAAAPNLVCTTFVASALLDAYEETGNSACLQMAASAAEYIVDKLFWTKGTTASFSYPQAGLTSQIHNANFLAAALLCRISKHTSEKRFLQPALKAARCSAAKQQADGSWNYGEAQSQQWVDNFHTGYNLRALRAIDDYRGTTEFEGCVRTGFRFYRDHFFCEGGAVRYFHDRAYPVDIHCIAESIITLLTLKDLDPKNTDLARSIFQWALNHMWDNAGFFYYRVTRFGKIRTSYMRWSQAWMVLAMSRLLYDANAKPSSQLRNQLTNSASQEIRSETRR